MFWLFETSHGLTQKQIILEMLKKGGEVSPRDMMLKWIARYGAHIFRLRKEWYPISMREEITRDAQWKAIVTRHTFYSLNH